MFRTLPCSRLTLVSFLTFVLQAQEPVRIPFGCSEAELQTAGLLCTEEEPCPIYLEINAIAPAGKRVFLGGDIHATSSTIASVLLSSDDGGVTWKEPAARIPGASIDQLEIYDLEHGWGAGGTQYPLSRDPFLLVTSDGGLSWRRRDVTEDGGPGSILRFWFDSARHGELIVDAGKSASGGRYLMYESETGGESWMARSITGQLPKIRRAPPTLDNPDFRVTAAAGGKTYVVEKRAGEKWEPMGSLLIEIASCKLKPGDLKEPPPEVEVPPANNYVDELKLGPPSPKAVAPNPAASVKKGSPNE